MPPHTKLYLNAVYGLDQKYIVWLIMLYYWFSADCSSVYVVYCVHSYLERFLVPFKPPYGICWLHVCCNLVQLTSNKEE